VLVIVVTISRTYHRCHGFRSTVATRPGQKPRTGQLGPFGSHPPSALVNKHGPDHGLNSARATTQLRRAMARPAR
jgi:hypothetical protein